MIVTNITDDYDNTTNDYNNITFTLCTDDDNNIFKYLLFFFTEYYNIFFL